MRFGLHDQANLVIGLVQVVVYAVPARGARHGRAETANTLRRIAHIPDQLPGLLRRVDHRHQQGLRADIQKLLEQCRAPLSGPHKGRHPVGRDGLQVSLHIADAIGRVLGIDEHPVKTRPGANLGADRIEQAHPQAVLSSFTLDNRTLGASTLGSISANRALKPVDRQFHNIDLFRQSGRLCRPVDRSRRARCRPLLPPPAR